MSDYKGTAQLLSAFPKAKELLTDREYDAGWFRNALFKRGITSSIPPRKSRKLPVIYSKELYKQRHKIMFGRIKNWRHIAMRYDRCAHLFFSAICNAAVVIFYFN